MPDPDDETLLARIRTRDADAFECLFGRYREALRRHLDRIVRDEGASGDLVQEVFLRVWTRPEQWEGRGAVRAWLFRIATHLALNHLRSQRRRRELPLLPAPDDEETDRVPGWMLDAASLGPEAVAELAEQRRLLTGLIDHLPEEKRELLRMVAEEGLEVREAAARLGIPEGTARSRLHYARRSLAREWDRTLEGGRMKAQRGFSIRNPQSEIRNPSDGEER